MRLITCLPKVPTGLMPGRQRLTVPKAEGQWAFSHGKMKQRADGEFSRPEQLSESKHASQVEIKGLEIITGH